MSTEALQKASSNLKQLYSMRDSIRLDADDILEVKYIENGRDRWHIVHEIHNLAGS